MIDWLLSLFPQYHALREALQQESTRALILQDRLDSALNDRSRMWETMMEALRGERQAYQSAINSQWQKQGFGAPYPEAPKLPASTGQQGGGTAGNPMPKMPSQRVAQQTSDFINSYRT